MEKECEICGAFFETNNKNRKYCEDCATHTRARWNEYERARIRTYLRTYEPPIFSGTCAECEKDFRILERHRFIQKEPETGEMLDFCGKRCMRDWRRKHNVCDTCGKLLKENIMRVSMLPDRKFCSKDCQNSYLRREGIIIRIKRKCEYCGKVFENKNGYFCSSDCYRKARTAKLNYGQKDNVAEEYLVKHIYCNKCGREIDVAIHFPLDDSYRIPAVLCKACKAKRKVSNLKTGRRWR